MGLRYSSGLAVTCLITMGACAHGGGIETTPSTVTCEGEVRVLQECDWTLNQSYSGALAVGTSGVAVKGARTKTQADQNNPEARNRTVILQDLCRDYNGCLLTKAEYKVAKKRLRDPPLRDGPDESNPPPSPEAQTTSGGQGEAPPSPEAQTTSGGQGEAPRARPAAEPIPVAVPRGPLAKEALTTYLARLSRHDHYNSKGRLLKRARAIVRQDRANYHKLGKRDPEDESDTYFQTVAKRGKMSVMLRISESVARRIEKGTPLIRVTIHDGYADVVVVRD